MSAQNSTSVLRIACERCNGRPLAPSRQDACGAVDRIRPVIKRIEPAKAPADSIGFPAGLGPNRGQLDHPGLHRRQLKFGKDLGVTVRPAGSGNNIEIMTLAMARVFSCRPRHRRLALPTRDRSRQGTSPAPSRACPASQATHSCCWPSGTRANTVGFATRPFDCESARYSPPALRPCEQRPPSLRSCDLGGTKSACRRSRR